MSAFQQAFILHYLTNERVLFLMVSLSFQAATYRNQPNTIKLFFAPIKHKPHHQFNKDQFTWTSART